VAEQNHDGAEIVKPTILHGGFPVPESVEVNFAQFLISELGYGACTHFPEGFASVVFGFVVEDEVDKVLERKLLGYRSRAEFVAEAVRDKLIQVKKS
jgi:hypothetical protein